MGRMDGKVAVVTGAGSGIGRAVAVMFAKEGAKVVCANRNETQGNKTLEMIKQVGGSGIFVKCDIRRKDEIKELLDKTLETYGYVSTLFNCAGVLVHKPFLEHTDEDYDLINETNFRGHYWAMQIFLPALIKHGHSSITNVASISYYKPESNAYIYGAFKAAMNKMTRDMVRNSARRV